MSQVISIQSRRALTARGLTTTTSIRKDITPGSERAGFVARIMAEARDHREAKALFRRGQKVHRTGERFKVGIVQDILVSDSISYVVSYNGDRNVIPEIALIAAGE